MRWLFVGGDVYVEFFVGVCDGEIEDVVESVNVF